MRKYVIEVTVYTGNDEFWEDIEHNPYTTGCDQVLELVRECLFTVTDYEDIKLIKFTEKE